MDACLHILGASVGLAVDKGAVEGGSVKVRLQLKTVGFGLGEVAPRGAGVFQGGIMAVELGACIVELHIQPHQVPLFPLRPLFRLHGACLGQGDAVGHVDGGLGECGLGGDGDAE